MITQEQIEMAQKERERQEMLKSIQPDQSQGNTSSIDGLASMVSDDNNDLDNLEFSTSNGINVSLKNNRGVDLEGKAIVPTVSALGNLNPISLPTQKQPEVKTKQPTAVSAFIGEDISDFDSQVSTDDFGNPLATDDFGNQVPYFGNADTRASQMNSNQFDIETPTDLIEVGIETPDELLKVDGTTAITPYQAIEADNKAKEDIIVSAKGDTQVEDAGNEVKAQVDEVASQIQSGEVDKETGMSQIKGLLVNLGDLMGVEGKDVTRALVRYAESRVAGFGGVTSAAFAYKGFEGDHAPVTANDTTSSQKNFAAYKNELSKIDERVAAGELSTADGAKEKQVANQIYKVDKQQRVSYYNIQGLDENLKEDIVQGRTTSRGEQEVLMDGKWVPIAESGLTGTQLTTKSSTQAVEKGVYEPRRLAEIK